MPQPPPPDAPEGGQGTLLGPSDPLPYAPRGTNHLLIKPSFISPARACHWLGVGTRSDRHKRVLQLVSPSSAKEHRGRGSPERPPARPRSSRPGLPGSSPPSARRGLRTGPPTVTASCGPTSPGGQGKHVGAAPTRPGSRERRGPLTPPTVISQTHHRCCSEKTNPFVGLLEMSVSGIPSLEPMVIKQRHGAFWLQFKLPKPACVRLAELGSGAHFLHDLAN
ncbi:uncharacterized protein LOC143642845 isoform X1 [Tamandua tetradactyla]|uniref:uncharacterized protein LOC143642845 isoform X1 n=1 Tax=Tamandua tetradactyla TaxID=48850 RepID=UPI0040547A6C